MRECMCVHDACVRPRRHPCPYPRYAFLCHCPSPYLHAHARQVRTDLEMLVQLNQKLLQTRPALSRSFTRRRASKSPESPDTNSFRLDRRQTECSKSQPAVQERGRRRSFTWSKLPTTGGAAASDTAAAGDVAAGGAAPVARGKARRLSFTRGKSSTDIPVQSSTPSSPSMTRPPRGSGKSRRASWAGMPGSLFA